MCACCVGGQGCQGICLSNNRYSLNSCVSYQLNTQTFIISHNFWSQESKSSSASLFWSRVSPGGFQQEATQNCSIWRPGWPWKIQFQDGSLTQLLADTYIPCWLLTEGFSSSAAPGGPHNVRVTSRWEQAWSYSVLLWPHPWSHILKLLLSLFIWSQSCPHSKEGE